MKRILILMILCMITAALPARGSKDSEQDGNTFLGTVSVKGTEPRTWVALTLKDGRVYELKGPVADTIRAEYQGQTLLLEGRISREAAGPGVPAEVTPSRIIKIINTGE